MSWWDKLKPKPETPEQKAALANLDEVTREVGSDELTKELEREKATGMLGPGAFLPGVPSVPFHHVPGDPVPEPVDDPDPGGGESMHDVMHEDGEKQ